MKHYIDSEFDGHGGPLLSIAMVGDAGRSLYIETTAKAHDPWVMANVVPVMSKHHADDAWIVKPDAVGSALLMWIGESEHLEVVADSPVDIARFCAAISTGSDGRWASVDIPRISFEVHDIKCYPTDLPGAVQHNAWWDAMALRHALRETV